MKKMNKASGTGLLALACLTVGLGGLWIGYSMSQLNAPPIENKLPSRLASGEDSISPPADTNETPFEPGLYAMPEKIKTTTKMVYEYYYEDDGKTEISEEYAPYFLLEKTEEALREMFTDWELISFSSGRVVMRKTMDGQSNQHYILGVQDGFLAIFYSRPVNGVSLKEITSTPVNALSAEERRKLREGIPVDGDENLMRLLEDYGS